MRPLALLIAAAALAGCGGKTIRPEGAADTITKFVASQTGFHATDVKCPSGVDAKVGGTFDCHFTGPEGPYVAHMRIREVEGERVLFDIKTQRQ